MSYVVPMGLPAPPRVPYSTHWPTWSAARTGFVRLLSPSLGWVMSIFIIFLHRRVLHRTWVFHKTCLVHKIQLRKPGLGFVYVHLSSVRHYQNQLADRPPILDWTFFGAYVRGQFMLELSLANPTRGSLSLIFPTSAQGLFVCVRNNNTTFLNWRCIWRRKDNCLSCLRPFFNKRGPNFLSATTSRPSASQHFWK